MVAPTLAPQWFAPPSRAAWFVERLWVARTPAGLPPEVLVPDGRPTVEVRLAGAATLADPFSRVRTPVVSAVHGLRTVPVVLDQPGGSWTVGARLAPHGLLPLLPGRALVDDSAPLGECLGLDEAGLAERLRGATDDAQVAALLAEALTDVVRRPTPAEQLDLVRAVVREIDAERGLVRPVDLVRSLGRSTAVLHKVVSDEIGVTLRTLLAVSRFSHAVRDLAGLEPDARGAYPGAPVAGVLRRYVDAAYPAREVERFTGLEPLDLRRMVRGIEELVAVA
ncbi:hypothetical protein [Cellulomonas hominis]